MHAAQICTIPSQTFEQDPPLMINSVQFLVDRAQGGDHTAFTALYERFAPKIYCYLYRHLRGRHETAEDLTAEVFVKVLARLDTYEFRGLPFSAWLYRIAHNHLIDHLRTRPRDLLDPPGWEQLPEPAAERMLECALDRQELAQALAQLSEQHRRVITLRFLHGRSIAETAMATGKTPDAVKKAQVRGLARLRRILEPTSAVDHHAGAFVPGPADRSGGRPCKR